MKSIIMLFALGLSSIILFIRGTGSITGRIIDDSTGNPVANVKIIIMENKLSVTSDKKGFFSFDALNPGSYSLKASCNGYKNIVERVTVKADSTITIDFSLKASANDLGKLKNAAKSEIMVMKEFAVSDQANGLYCTVEGNYSEPNTEEYNKINESGFLETIKNPLSTFAADVDAASYSNCRRFIMENSLPYKDAIRVEEFVNYFDYSYKQPKKENPLSINMEYSDCPWNEKNNIIRIGLKGKELSKEEQKVSNIVFLIDVSGSMESPEKLPLLKQSFRMLVNQLKPDDKISIVVYAGNAGLVLPPTKGSNKKIILKAIELLEAGGSTAGGEGIQLAYKIAMENFIKDGNNRVILATDGDFNVGISSTSELVRFIEDKKDAGIFLTVLGFGMGNYKDNRLQELADRGNGNHAYIDNIMEAKKVLVNSVTSTLFTIAKDVKIQVEFNPAKIKSYRLIGYENRILNEKDFKDDKKDAGEIGAGHTVTALYEVEPNNYGDSEYDLKYQHTQIKDKSYNTDEILTVRIRYKDPDESISKEFSEVLKGNPLEMSKTSEDHRFALSVAEFAMLLRDSEYKGDSNIDKVIKTARSSKGRDNFGYREEFINIAERAKLLLNDQSALLE